MKMGPKTVYVCESKILCINHFWKQAVHWASKLPKIERRTTKKNQKCC